MTPHDPRDFFGGQVLRAELLPLVAVHLEIDEARHDIKSVRIQDFVGIAGLELAHFGNFPILNTNVAEVTRGPRSINNGSALNDRVKCRHIYYPYKFL